MARTSDWLRCWCGRIHWQQFMGYRPPAHRSWLRCLIDNIRDH